MKVSEAITSNEATPVAVAVAPPHNKNDEEDGNRMKQPLVVAEAISIDNNDPQSLRQQGEQLQEATTVSPLSTQVSHKNRRHGCSCFCRHCGICLLVTVMVLVAMTWCTSNSHSSFGSCLGDGACKGNTGHVAPGSCNGDAACQYNAGRIAAGACNGDGACVNNTGALIQALSCNGDGACVNNEATVIAKASCNGDRACRSNAGTVADASTRPARAGSAWLPHGLPVPSSLSR